MKRRLLALVLVVVMIATCFAACKKKSDDSKETTTPKEKETITLRMWGAEEDQTLLRTMADAFIALHKDDVNLTIEIGVESESTAKDTVLADVEAAADVFAFADDQLASLVQAGALQEVVLNTDAVIEANGGKDSGSVQAASSDGKLFAYPMTADNGYFLFYDSSKFTEEDVKTFDGILAAAATAGQKVSFELTSGWYLYSFFQGAGLTLKLNEDGKTNDCNWNATDTDITGVEVTQAILDIVSNEMFVSPTDAEFATGVADGTIIAGVNGSWNAATAEEAWGDNYAACKLPTYTVDGKQVQMSSFAGYKLVGVNKYSANVGWAMQLAEYITNYDNQVLRFKERGLGPSNVLAAASEEVQTNPAIAAIASQSQYATVQRVGDKFWLPTETFGNILKLNNADGTALQTLLDNLVVGITAAVE